MKLIRTLFRVAAILSLAVLISCSSKEVTMLIGTYTDGGTSRGAYSYSFNQKTGEARQISSVETGNPSFIVPSIDGKHAYSVNQFQDGRQGASSYILEKDGTLSILNSVSGLPAEGVEICGFNLEEAPLAGRDTEIAGAGPCNILVDGGHVITANYTGGDVTVYPINKDGSLGKVSQFIRFNHSPHIHCAVFSPDSAYVFFTDLGNDRVFRFTVDRNSDSAYLKDCIVAYQGEPGYGPRHLVFNAKGDKAYMIDELGDMLVCMNYTSDHIFDAFQTFPAYDGEGHGSADIHLSPDGKFLYTSHRLEKDGIAIFGIGPDGKAEMAGYQPTGIHPRNFAVSPDGKWVLAACRDSDTIQIFRRNTRTGTLKHWKEGMCDISLSKPVCISWVK